MPTLDQTWDDLGTYVEQMFFSDLQGKVEGYAKTLATLIEKNVNRQLNTFFKDLAGMIQPGLEGPPDDLAHYSDESTWAELSDPYYKWKNPSSKARDARGSDFFMLSELARIKRNSSKSRAQWRQKRVLTGKELKASPSLRMQISKLANPSAYYGKVTVTITSHTKLIGGGVRRSYKTGVQRNGEPMRGRVALNSDFVTLSVDWLPAISGLDPLVRGVTENPPPGKASKGLQRLPDDVRKKLNGHAFNHNGPAYRPLLGPYMLWYQDTKIRKIIADTIAPYGPIQ